MIKYMLSEQSVIDGETGACIPLVPDNRHYREYQEWLADRNLPCGCRTLLMRIYRCKNDKKYKLTESGVKDIETGAFIPNCNGNSDWQRYLQWVDEGNTPDPEFTQTEIDNKNWESLRTERNKRLTATDFMMTYDYYNNLLTVQEQTDLTTYLRDLPANTVDPTNPTWPIKPQAVIDCGL